MKTVYIYGLMDERDRIRYIGQTINPAQRLAQHLEERVNTPKSLWVQSMIQAGNTLRMVILSESDTRNANYEEKWWITLGARHSWQLTNMANPSKKSVSFHGMFTDAMRDEFDQFMIEHDPVMMITRKHVRSVAVIVKLLVGLALGGSLGYIAYVSEYNIANEGSIAFFYAFVSFLFPAYFGFLWAWGLELDPIGRKAMALCLAPLAPLGLIWLSRIGSWFVF
ncbi:MAG TPA: GIY-YIG nuclease family protein [Pseudomonadales bacterium]|nr:GIY-YIG nuclease family protein [Pseudomonadales bacterium]